MHDGLKGRKHVYSYINHDDAWWKVVGHTVTKVTFDTVLNDKDGMHLGAGPFLLIYSRPLSEPLINEWPDVIKVGARADSSEFLEKFPPSFQQAAYNPSTNVVLDDKPSSTLPHAGPGRTPPEATQVPLALNAVRHPGYAVGTPE